MPKKIFLLLSAMLVCLQVNAQLIHWRSDRPLTWDDYMGKPDFKSRGVVATSWQVYYKTVYSTHDSIAVKMYCSFNCFRSWKSSLYLPAALLKHEQLHFDIAELYTRRIRRALSEFHKKHQRPFKSTNSIHGLTAPEYKRLHRYQRQYDRETKRSQDQAKQEEWNKRVARELEELKAYEEK
ncbi:MAG: DUF922 domain-containing protein [Bacteroidota bacterium]